MKLCCCFSHVFYPLKFVENYWKSACDKRYQRRFYLFIFKHWFEAIESSMSKFFFSCVYQINPLELTLFPFDDVIKATDTLLIWRILIVWDFIWYFLFFQKSNNVMKRAKIRNFRFKIEKNLMYFFSLVLTIEFSLAERFYGRLSLNHIIAQAKPSFSIEYYFKMLSNYEIK